MQRRSIVTSIVLLALILGACAAQQPTANPVDIQNTALALAATYMAATQTALPTPSPTVTATPTPIPTETPFPIATYESLITFYNPGATPPFVPNKMKISTMDGMFQVYIPAGPFLMGTNNKTFLSSYPEHQVYLDAYWIDQTLVSNGMFARCVQAGVCSYIYGVPEYNPRFADPAFASYPITYVTWFDADQYCRWAGRRLPTEAEWEKAARGLSAASYPWGEETPNPTMANFEASHLEGPVSVYSHPNGASSYGVLGMAGNMREWMADWFNPSYYVRSPDQNPQGASQGDKKSLRGGSYLDGERGLLSYMRFSHEPQSPGANRGFRCVQDEVN